MNKRSLPELDTEYMLMKKSLYRKFFLDFFRVCLIVPVLEISRSFILEEPKIFYNILKILAFLVISTVLISKVGNYKESYMTIYFSAFYAVILLAHVYGDSLYVDDPNQAFNFGSTSTVFAGAIANRIPKFKHRMFFNVAILLLRLVIMPPAQYSFMAVDFAFLAFKIYLDYDRERHDEKLFDSYFYSKDQLQRFKDLVVSDIPDSIVIINQEMNQCLFANNSFNKLFEGSYDRSIYTCLGKLYIQESLSEETRASYGSGTESLNDRETLLIFIKNHLRQEGKRTNFTRTSCNASFRKNADGSDRRNSFDRIQNPSEYSFDVKILPLVWDEKPAIGIILHDITQQNTIIRLKVAANIQKDRILATVSHELRTPLNGMLGMIQVMEEKIKDKEMLHYLEICNNSGHLLLSLVNSILDMNMIKANKLKLNPERFSLNDFLADIMKLFNFHCSQKKIYFKLNSLRTVKISSLVPKMIMTDKNRLSQIFINLIGNAVKFTQQGGIKISVEPCIESRKHIMMNVEDTGIGIKEEDKNKLFRMFGKLDYQGTIVNSQGVGLGLTIANSLAKLLCKDQELAGIQVKTEYKKGSKFSFIIDKELLERNQGDILDTSSDFLVSGLDEGEMEDKQLDDHLSPLRSARKKLNFKLKILDSDSLY